MVAKPFRGCVGYPVSFRGHRAVKFAVKLRTLRSGRKTSIIGGIWVHNFRDFQIALTSEHVAGFG